MAGKYVVAVDQGTTGTTVLVLDRTLQVLSRVNREFPQHFPKPGHVEHDLEDIWTSVVLTVNEALRKARVRGAHEALPRVRTPAIVLWGARDAVVPRKAVELAAKRIGSGPARLAVFPRSAHQLALDVEREAVASEVARFFAVFARQEAARQEG